MLFNSFVFLFAFLPIAYTVFWSLNTANQRYLWLAFAGYVFYSWWNPWFCLLLAFSTLVSYTAGLGFLSVNRPQTRWLLLAIPITVDLLLLGFFKYAGFVVSSAQALLDSVGAEVRIPTTILLPTGDQLALNEIILPVGISFYTFHTISYIVDSWRGTIRPTRNLFEFAAYVALFPQLVAGPIVRFRQIERDLEALGKADRTRWLGVGIAFFMVGLVEKVLVADTLAGFVDPAMENHDALSTFGAWMAMLGYTLQLYFDFSGYSSMAIGLGFMFGLRIPINFNSPYKAVNPSDFWQRWHISLSTCMRDYIYIPLGGNRKGELNTLRNLMLTMLIGGLWHGANWTFVVWGAYHGLLLCLYRWRAADYDRLPLVAQRAVMLVAVVIGWVFFRSIDLQSALELLRIMFIPTGGILVDHPAAYLVILAVAGWWAVLGPNSIEMIHDFRWRPIHSYLFAGAFGSVLTIIGGGRESPFLYFQF